MKMRTSNFVVFFALLWGCVLTEDPPNLETAGDSTVATHVITEDNITISGNGTTPESGQPVLTQYSGENSKNVIAESLIDRIIDLAIRHIKEKTTGAIKLSDEVKEFNRKFIIIPIKGEMILFNGELNGINSIKRAGNATYSVHNGEIDVNTTFQFDELDFIYDFQANIYKLSTDGVCKGNITKLITDVGLGIKIKEKEIELTRLKLIAAKTLRIQLDSAKFKDKVINYLLKTVTSIFKTALLSQLEKELQEYVGKSIHYSVSRNTNE